MGKCIDLTGQKFGRLTVVERAENYVSKSGSQKARWLCKCDCGNEVIVTGSELRSKKTTSCGCYRKEMTSKRAKRYNTFNLSGLYGIGYTLNGDEFWFDIKDYDLIKNICWRKNSAGYIVGYYDVIQKDVSLHRMVMGFPDGLEVDHIHGELTRHDNRKKNLRICTHAENKRNVNMQSNNTSGITGVSFDKENNKWFAHITINQKLINLGRFDKFEDAITARKEAEDKYFGEFSYNNSQRIGVA